jgi:hypothetical protein
MLLVLASWWLVMFIKLSHTAPQRKCAIFINEKHFFQLLRHGKQDVQGENFQSGQNFHGQELCIAVMQN